MTTGGCMGGPFNREKLVLEERERWHKQAWLRNK